MGSTTINNFMKPALVPDMTKILLNLCRDERKHPSPTLQRKKKTITFLCVNKIQINLDQETRQVML